MNQKIWTAILFFTLASNCNAQTCPLPLTVSNDRYTDLGNGTVLDNVTFLIWKKCSEGQSGVSCAGQPFVFTWAASTNHAAVHSFAGFDDWRIPNAKELYTLVETSCYGPAINSSIFPNSPIVWFWTSTSAADSSNRAMCLDFYSGILLDRSSFSAVGSFSSEKQSSNAVRLVRAGQ